MPRIAAAQPYAVSRPARIRLLLESSADAVMIHDPETYDVIWANRVAADIYGCSPDS
jgi:PAS domain-containing protein